MSATGVIRQLPLNDSTSGWRIIRPGGDNLSCRRGIHEPGHLEPRLGRGGAWRWRRVERLLADWKACIGGPEANIHLHQLCLGQLVDQPRQAFRGALTDHIHVVDGGADAAFEAVIREWRKHHFAWENGKKEYPSDADGMLALASIGELLLSGKTTNFWGDPGGERDALQPVAFTFTPAPATSSSAS